MYAKSAVLSALTALLVYTAVIASPATAAQAAAADNSASNSAHERMPADANTPTAPADDLDDARVSAQIHAAVAGDKSLSVLARNITISSNPQAVVLRGSVASQDKERIESLAERFAGSRQVIDRLLIADL